MLFRSVRIPALRDYENSFRSHDLSETRKYVANAICPHNISMLDRNQELDARVGRYSFGPINFLYIKHGAAVHINPGRPQTVYLIQIPMGAASYHVEINDLPIRANENTAYVVSPTQKVEMRFSEYYEHIVMTVDKDHLGRYLERTLQRPLDRPLEFEPLITCMPGTEHELLNLILYFIQQLSLPETSIAKPEIRSRASELILSMMIFGLRHNFSENIRLERFAAKPRFIKRAEEYIRIHAKEPLTPENIARAACVSRRSLFSGFKRYLQCTPMTYVREVKLDCVRNDLMSAEPITDRVSRIALDYSFYHLGNFTASYKRKFGELPSHTLYYGSGDVPPSLPEH